MQVKLMDKYVEKIVVVLDDSDIVDWYHTNVIVKIRFCHTKVSTNSITIQSIFFKQFDCYFFILSRCS